MGIITDALFGLIIIAAVFWLSALMNAASADRKRRDAELAEAAERERLLERDRRMRTERIQLRCVACDRLFRGPLTDDGCPDCHSGALVVPELDFRRGNAHRN